MPSIPQSLLLLYTLAQAAFATNQTELNACLALNALTKHSLNTAVYFVPYTTDSLHWVTSSTQASTCVYLPASPEDLAAGVKLIGEQRVRFAISCSGHAMNPGFSSTPGIHISMHRFQNVSISTDRSYVDIGGGISWADVYSKLDGTGLSVVGGRVPGPGIGGFKITGGGGYSWKTNRYGLTGDTLILAKLVLPNGTLTTASDTVNPDLFWAIRGGGNRFGVLYSLRLQAIPQSSVVYGGVKLLTGDEIAPLLNATHNFANTNQDLHAQILPTVNYIEGEPSALLIALYDDDPGDINPFASFNASFNKQSFSSFVGSIPSLLQSGHRGSFNTVNFQSLSMPVLEQIKNQSRYWGQQMLAHSGSFVSLELEAFAPYAQFAKDAAWPHTTNSLPLNIYYSWDDAQQDDFWHSALKETARVLAETAKADGQELNGLNLYPNYAIAGTPAKLMYTEPNLIRLRQLQKVYDPNGVMLLTTFFDFE
ncbi:hypothetical protein AMS68_005962 [Peltaster fructicola]|uniref:FAD-binding PCMH-type domain-containing protein n=1 Tax=Peltaster fructicola TaxID=286661 RepID=A0A6H0Y0L0_9PEZI|nr:hypothetical protein AMS68_005962 [Peltaster fructicola]